MTGKNTQNIKVHSNKIQTPFKAKSIKWSKDSLTTRSTTNINLTHRKKPSRSWATVAGQWGKPTQQPRYLIPIRRN